MVAVHSSDSSAEEFELDLTSEKELALDRSPSAAGAGAQERPPAAAEQRQTDRQEASSLVGTVEYRDRKVAVRIDDLSVGGVGLSLDSRLPLNEECKLTITLSVCGSDYELTMKSRVRHCDALNSRTYHAGLQFIDMDQATRDTLILLVR